MKLNIENRAEIKENFTNKEKYFLKSDNKSTKIIKEQTFSLLLDRY